MLKIWFTEQETDHLHVQHRVERVLYQGRSKYQEIAVIETADFGRMLVLDGIIQTTLRDEFIYHEMLAHVPLFTHHHPERVLVIGGGDGGTVREVLRHSAVQEVKLVEIDAMVIEACREFLPELAGCLDDPRTEVCVEDGLRFVQDRPGEFDVVIVDSTDPVGPAKDLFAAPFYGDVARALRPGGLMSVQAESPFFTPDLVRGIHRSMRMHFSAVRLFMASVPTYSVSPWGFMLAAKDARKVDSMREAPRDFGTRYYSADVHAASFVLPPYVEALLQSEEE